MPYPTDLSDQAWDLITHLVPEAKSGGRPEKYPKREILNGILYILRGGCAWRLLPHDFPPWPMVDHDFGLWRQDGTWQVMHDMLRGDVRMATGKHRQPRAGIIESPSVNTTETGGPRRRYRQTRQRPHTPYPRRDMRVAAGRGGHGRQCARPRWGYAALGCPPVQVFPTPADLGGSGLWRRTPRVGMGATPLAERPLGHGQTARGDQGLPPAAEALGGGADLWVVGPLPPMSQR